MSAGPDNSLLLWAVLAYNSGMTLGFAILLVVLGLVPSLIWLAFFIKKDIHPEPKYLVTKVFLMGIIISPLAIILELGLTWLSGTFSIDALAANTPAFFLWAAFVEEFTKFLAVYFIALRSPEFDEPIDAMIYMMVAGLGFAAIENTLVLFRTIPSGTQAALTVWVLRSTGATLLHALSSSLVGYFLAMAWFFRQHHRKLLIVGLLLATLFHFSFNMFLSAADGQITGLAYATGLLLIMAFLVSVLFDKIRERHAMTSASAIAVPVSAINNT